MSDVLKQYGVLLPGRDLSEFCYRHETLGQVITIQEAARIWCKSRSAILHQIWRGRLDSRLSITGGATLILKASMIEVYGLPVDDQIIRLHTPEYVKFEGKH